METLEVTIGIVVYFLLMSLVASSIAEMISSWRRTRGRMLREAVRLTVGGGESFCTEVYRHPLINALYESEYSKVDKPVGIWEKVFRTLWPSKQARQSLPSYIPPDSFARAYVETVLGTSIEDAGDLGAVFAGEKRSWADLRVATWRDVTKLKTLGKALCKLLAAAKGDTLKVVEQLSELLKPPTPNGLTADEQGGSDDKTMRALETAYAALQPLLVGTNGDTQKTLAAVAALLNAVEPAAQTTPKSGEQSASEIRGADLDNAYESVRPLVLAAQGDSAKTLELVAEQFTKVNERATGRYKRLLIRNLFFIGLLLAFGTNGDATRVVTRLNSDPGLRAEMRGLANSMVGTNQTANSQLRMGTNAFSDDAIRRELLTRVRILEGVSGGWAGDPALEWEKKWHLAPLWLLKLLGFLITACAVSLGAPFWFDLLSKLVNIRNTLKDKAEEGEGSARRESRPRTEAEVAAHLAARNAGVSPASFTPSPAALALEREMARFSELAYLGILEFKARLKALGYATPMVEFITQRYKNEVDTQVYVVRTAERLVVAFRGTEPSVPADIITDVKFELGKVDWSEDEAFAHAGFQSALQIVWDRVLVMVRKFNDENPLPVHFCGHSLGGALAVLAAARYLRDKTLTEAEQIRRANAFGGVHTIGQPRVGDAAFGKWAGKLFRGNYTRTLNNRDAVPRVPPTTNGKDYKHFGTVHFYDSHGKLWVNPTWFFRLLDYAVPDKEFRELAKEPIADHAAAEYVRLYNLSTDPPTKLA